MNASTYVAMRDLADLMASDVTDGLYKFAKTGCLCESTCAKAMREIETSGAEGATHGFQRKVVDLYVYLAREHVCDLAHV